MVAVFGRFQLYIRQYLPAVEKGFANEARLCRVIKEYNKCKEQRNKLVMVAKAIEEENAKLAAEKAELLKQFEAKQVNLQGLRQNLCSELGKVTNLEEKLRTIEDNLLVATKREPTSREATMEEAMQWVVEEFKNFE